MKYAVVKYCMMLAVVFGLFMLGACGGGDSSSPATAATATGKFIDSPVSGMTYESGSHKGTTGADGSFTYEVGKNVKFSIGGIVIGEAPALGIMTPIHLAAAGSNAATPEVVARVQLLMSLSSTDPSGVITIDPSMLTSAQNKTLNFLSATLQADLAALVTSLGKTLVTPADAQNHLTGNINKLFQGNYSGTFKSDVSAEKGTWNFTFDANGNVSGTATGALSNTKYEGTEPGSGSMQTVIDSGTKFVYTGTVSGVPWKGTLDVITNTFSGTWVDNNNSEHGTFTGNLNQSVTVAVPTAPLTGHSISITTTAATPPAGAIVPLPQTSTFTYSSNTAWTSATVAGNASGTYTYVTTSTTTSTYHYVQTNPGTATGDLTFTATSATGGTFTGTLSAPGVAAFPVSGIYTVLN